MPGQGGVFENHENRLVAKVTDAILEGCIAELRSNLFKVELE